MKKVYMLLSGLTAVFTAVAQPTITAAEFNPVVGETTILNTYNATGVSPGSAGSGVTWNFAAITSTGTQTNTYVAPGGTPYAASFSSSNLAADAGGGAYGYFQTSASGFFNWGVGTASTTIAYSNSEQLFALPFTYNSTWTDNFLGNYTSGGFPATRSGTTTGQVDGFGTLVMPYGTYANILRVKLVQDYSDVINVSGTPFTYDYDVVLYYWIKEGTHMSMLSHTAFTSVIMGGSPSTSYSGTYLDAAAVGLGENEADAFSFALFPNPSTGRQIQLAFNAAQNENVTVNIFSATGQLVQNTMHAAATGFNPVQLDLASLEAGVYIVQLQTANGSVSKKLVLE